MKIDTHTRPVLQTLSLSFSLYVAQSTGEYTPMCYFAYILEMFLGKVARRLKLLPFAVHCTHHIRARNGWQSHLLFALLLQFIEVERYSFYGFCVFVYVCVCVRERKGEKESESE